MEIEKTPPKMAKKVWNLVRIMLYMMRKGIYISKSKLMLDLDFIIKRGKIASKAIGDLMIHHHHYHYHYYSALSCRYEDDVLSSFISPREYEFSCSNSPAAAYPYHNSRRMSSARHDQQYYRPKYDHRNFHRGGQGEVLHKVFDILDHSHDDEYPVMGTLPGLGNISPVLQVRQLRVTDSPFAVNDHHSDQENHQVDKDAEKFIKRFYKDLRNQRRIAAALESPPSYHM